MTLRYFLVLWVFVPTLLLAQFPVNGDFEMIGTDTAAQFTLSSTFNGQTCMNDGGVITATGNFIGQNRPIGFRTTDDYFNIATPTYVTPTTDAFSGSTALRLSGDGAFGFGFFGIFGVETLVQAAFPVAYPYDQPMTAIEGVYKHTSGAPRTISAGSCTAYGPLSQDSIFRGGFAVFAEFYDADGTVIARADTILPDTTSYAAFSVPVETLTADTTLPATYRVIISSAPEFISPNPVIIPGSVSFVDDLRFAFEPTSTRQSFVPGISDLSVFPNPTRGELTIRTASVQVLPYHLYNVTGMLVAKGQLHGEVRLQIGDMPNGSYLLRVGRTQRWVQLTR